jgi:hypothetical protein
MAVNRISIPLAPTTGTERTDTTWRATGSDAWWIKFFNAWREEELRSTEGLVRPPR